MLHEGHLDLLEVLWGILVDREDSEDADTDDHDDEPKVDEVHDGGNLCARGIVRESFRRQSLVEVQTHLVTDGLKAFIEVHEVGRLWDSGEVES